MARSKQQVVSKPRLTLTLTLAQATPAAAASSRRAARPPLAELAQPVTLPSYHP